MKKVLSVLLILCLTLTAFAACGRPAASTGTDTPPAPASQTPTPAPEPEPEPEPEPVYDPAVLTGLPKGEDYPEGQRVTAIMVNNISNNAQHDVRPQKGLSEADVLMEMRVEGGITRFCALFSDYRTLPEIWPVRSARDQFFQVFLPWQPIFVHIGESVVQKQYKIDYTYDDMDVNLDTVGFKTDPRGANAGWEIAYTDGPSIQAAIDKLGTDTRRTYTSPIFDFVNYNEPARVLSGDAALGNRIKHSQSYFTYFDWDASAGKYLMSQYSLHARDILPSTDANNDARLAFENVIVLFTEFGVYPDPGGSGYDLQKVDFTFGGVGYYFSGGRGEPIRWKKGAPLEALYLLDAEGNETSVKVNPGRTYIAVVDLECAKGADGFGYNPTGTAQAETAASVQVDSDAAQYGEMDG